MKQNTNDARSSGNRKAAVNTIDNRPKAYSDVLRTQEEQISAAPAR